RRAPLFESRTTDRRPAAPRRSGTCRTDRPSHAMGKRNAGLLRGCRGIVMFHPYTSEESSCFAGRRMPPNGGLLMARKAKRPARTSRHPSTSARASGRRPDARGVQRAVQQTFGRSDLVAVGVLNLVRDTIVTALAGVKDVGGELRGAAVAAARGAIRAAYVISGDLGSVARETVRGTISAADEIGRQCGTAANSARPR